MFTAVFLTSLAAGPCGEQPLLATQQGPACGTHLPASGANLFLGIPYAEPPLGSLRWKAPQPPSNRSEPLDATQYGPGCLQLHHNPDVPPNQSASCLTLNVYTPPASCGTDLPVMLWLHGGSFEEGGSSLFFYNATGLAVSECVVVVTGNYRLGAFGAMFLPDLGFVGNQHLLDQRAMMQFIHDNAAALGVNSSRLTLFGQSAGAMSIEFHLTSPKSVPLFSQAILESPAALVYKSRKQAIEYSGAVAKEMGCKKTDAACMLNKTDAEVQAAWKAVGENDWNTAKIVLEWQSLAVALTFSPSVLEDDDWPVQPAEAAAAGKLPAKPLMMGSNEADAMLFVACGKKPFSCLEYEAAMPIAFGEHALGVFERYPLSHPRSDCSPTLSAVFSDFLFRCPVRNFANSLANATVPVPTFVYRFNHSLPFNIYNKSCCDNLPCHALEVPLVFDATGPFTLDHASALTSRLIRGLWGSFARTGNPNADPSNAVWPAYGMDAQRELVFQQGDETSQEAAITVLEGGKDECMTFWNTFQPFWDKPSD